MGYQIVKVPDTSIEVLDEKALDDKFKPEATWQTTYLKTKDPKHLMNGKEILAKIGELKDGILKIKAKWKTVSDDYPHARIPLLTYVSAKEVETYLKLHDNNELNAADFFTRIAIHEDRSFYHCEKCNGYIPGRFSEEEFDTIGGLAGTSGTNYNCHRCGTTLATLTLGYS